MSWRTRVLSAVDQWIDAAHDRGTGVSGRPARVPEVADARFAGEGGRYLIDLRGRERPLDLDSLERLQLRGSGTSYSVLRARQEDGLLELEVAGHVTERTLELWAVRRPPADLRQNLRERLANLGNPGLADHLARGRLSAPPPIPAHPSALNESQRQAYEACLRPGVFLVWGPPGTGKTKVLAKAIGELLNRGERVLLASQTNVALDNALQGVMELQQWEPGTLVRVGVPQVPEVASAGVDAEELARERQQRLEEDRQHVEQRLRGLAERAAPLATLEGRLGEYDHEAYREARGLIDRENAIARLASTAWEAQEEHERATHEESVAAQHVRECERRWSATEGARAHLEWAAQSEAYLSALAQEARDRAAAEAALEARAQAIRIAQHSRVAGVLAFARQWAQSRTLLSERRWLERETPEAQRLAELAQERLQTEQRRLVPEIAEQRRLAQPLDETQMQRLSGDLAGARAQLADASDAVQTAEAALDRARRELGQAEAGPRAAPEHRALVEWADAAGYPAAYEEAELLRPQVDAERDQVRQLEQHHEDLVRQIQRQVARGQAEIIREARLVATTLTRARLIDAVHEGPYAAVLIDEVSSATLPDLLVAVARAGSTAVLLGDFLQLKGVVDDEKSLAERRSPEVEEWLLTDVFAHCGVRTSADATRSDGGVIALDVQYRFGPDIAQLANDASYRGLLRVGDGVRRAPDEPEIVVIDTAGMDDLGIVRSTGRASGWWPAGALLASALARYRADRGERVGIVAPYKDQWLASLEALRDLEGDRPSSLIEVGTAHRLQGREFDSVVFDLVEDSGTRRWVAQGEWDASIAWQRDGARLFNVATTRGKYRLYVICHLAAVQRAAEGTVLASVRRLLDDGRIQVVPGTAIVPAPGGRQTVADDPLVEELEEALGTYVRVVGIQDEHEIFDSLRQYITDATESIWIWAPWTANRLRDVLPLLEGAVARGVRVTAFIRSDRDPQMAREPQRSWAERLAAAVPRTVRMINMHQKLVVVDDRTTIVGSCNVLSHHDTREVMVIHEGAHFARRILAQERAELFGAPPGCRACGAERTEIQRSNAKREHFRWWFTCGAEGCKERWPVPDAP